jgi:two-component system, chemotaxis family, chemotaxis protein CheY
MTAHILTVDDSPSVRLTTNVALTSAGYLVTEAVDGLDALNKAKTTDFDLIITDLNMPNMDGLEMIEALRRSPDHAGVPIIFLSTESDGQMKDRARAAGATGWMTKPFNVEQLIKITRKVLGK